MASSSRNTTATSTRTNRSPLDVSDERAARTGDAVSPGTSNALAWAVIRDSGPCTPAFGRGTVALGDGVSGGLLAPPL